MKQYDFEMDDAEVFERLTPMMNLTPTQRLVSAVLICELAELDNDLEPEKLRISITSTDNLMAWQVMGMCRFAEQLNFHDVRLEAGRDE